MMVHGFISNHALTVHGFVDITTKHLSDKETKKREVEGLIEAMKAYNLSED